MTEASLVAPKAGYEMDQLSRVGISSHLRLFRDVAERPATSGEQRLYRTTEVGRSETFVLDRIFPRTAFSALRPGQGAKCEVPEAETAVDPLLP